jgi:hypothetical protein
LRTSHPPHRSRRRPRSRSSFRLHTTDRTPSPPCRMAYNPDPPLQPCPPRSYTSLLRILLRHTPRSPRACRYRTSSRRLG